MSENDYDDLLNRSWDEIPEPQPLPTGHYVLKGRNANYVPPKGDSSGKVLFFYSPQEPMTDVDRDALDALGDNYDIRNNDVVATFWVDRPKDWDAVRQHLKLHGVDPSGTIKETLGSFKGSEVVAYLGSREFTRKDGSTGVDNPPSEFTRIEG